MTNYFYNLLNINHLYWLLLFVQFFYLKVNQYTFFLSNMYNQNQSFLLFLPLIHNVYHLY